MKKTKNRQMGRQAVTPVGSTSLGKKAPSVSQTAKTHPPARAIAGYPGRRCVCSQRLHLGHIAERCVESYINRLRAELTHSPYLDKGTYAGLTVDIMIK